MPWPCRCTYLPVSNTKRIFVKVWWKWEFKWCQVLCSSSEKEYSGQFWRKVKMTSEHIRNCCGQTAPENNRLPLTRKWVQIPANWKTYPRHEQIQKQNTCVQLRKWVLFSRHITNHAQLVEKSWLPFGVNALECDLVADIKFLSQGFVPR